MAVFLTLLSLSGHSCWDNASVIGSPLPIPTFLKIWVLGNQLLDLHTTLARRQGLITLPLCNGLSPGLVYFFKFPLRLGCACAFFLSVLSFLFSYNFKGHFPFAVITKYWLYFPCHSVEDITGSILHPMSVPSIPAPLYCPSPHCSSHWFVLSICESPFL